jgi:hypothetical protein
VPLYYFQNNFLEQFVVVDKRLVECTSRGISGSLPGVGKVTIFVSFQDVGKLEVDVEVEVEVDFTTDGQMAISSWNFLMFDN